MTKSKKNHFLVAAAVLAMATSAITLPTAAEARGGGHGGGHGGGGHIGGGHGGGGHFGGGGRRGGGGFGGGRRFGGGYGYGYRCGPLRLAAGLCGRYGY